MNINPANWSINEGVESEFRFWVKGMQNSVGLGTIFALAFSLLIAALPKGIEYPGGEFAGNLWPYLVEAAFTPIKTVCWIAAGLYAAVAIAHRRQSRSVSPLGERSVKR